GGGVAEGPVAEHLVRVGGGRLVEPLVDLEAAEAVPGADLVEPGQQAGSQLCFSTRPGGPGGRSLARRRSCAHERQGGRQHDGPRYETAAQRRDCHGPSGWTEPATSLWAG